MKRKLTHTFAGTVLVTGLVFGQSAVYAVSNEEEPNTEDLNVEPELIDSPVEEVDENVIVEEEPIDNVVVEEAPPVENIIVDENENIQLFSEETINFKFFSDKKIKVGDKTAFSLYVQEADGNMIDIASDAKWSINDTSIATSTGNGWFTGLKEGSATVSATYKGTTATVTLTVESKFALTGVSISADSFTITEGEYEYFFATATYSDGSTKNVGNDSNWYISDRSIATVNAGGGVTALKPGVTELTVTHNGEWDIVTVTVEPKPDYGDMSEFEIKFLNTEIGDSVMFGTIQTLKTSETEAVGISDKSFSIANLNSNLQTLESELKASLASELVIEPLPYNELEADMPFHSASGYSQGSANVVTNLEIPFAYFDKKTNQVVYKTSVDSLAIKIKIGGE